MRTASPLRGSHSRFHSSDPRPPAILLGGYANAVSVARSLSRSGVEVFALGDRASEVRHSRHRTGFVDLGTQGDVQGRWLAWLERSGPLGAVLLPCSDDGLELVARNRGMLLELGYRPIEADDEVALAMLDKSETYARAARLGVPTPRTYPVTSNEEIDEISASIGYPCALKPARAHEFHRRSGLPEKLVVVSSRAQLRERFASLAALGVELLVTEIIPGGDDQLPSYYTYLDGSGKPLLHFTTRKLRQFPPNFGHGCYRLSEWDSEVAALGLRFLQGVGVRGLAMTEFKRDPRDGKLKLIECNHRFTSATELVRLAGIDLATLTYRRALDLPVLPLSGFREGVYLWSPADDVRTFHAERSAGRLTSWDWVRSLLHRQHFPVFDWTDPTPTLAFHWSLFLRMLKTFRRR